MLTDDNSLTSIINILWFLVLKVPVVSFRKTKFTVWLLLCCKMSFNLLHRQTLWLIFVVCYYCWHQQTWMVSSGILLMYESASEWGEQTAKKNKNVSVFLRFFFCLKFSVVWPATRKCCLHCIFNINKKETT